MAELNILLIGGSGFVSGTLARLALAQFTHSGRYHRLALAVAPLVYHRRLKK